MVDPAPFEVQGDIDMPSHDGTRRSRLLHDTTTNEISLTPPLFHGYRFILDGDCRTLSRDQVTAIARQCGAAIHTELLPAYIATPEHFHIVCGIETNVRQLRAKYGYRFDQRRLVLATWLLDSISAYRVQNVEAYMFK